MRGRELGWLSDPEIAVLTYQHTKFGETHYGDGFGFDEYECDYDDDDDIEAEEREDGYKKGVEEMERKDEDAKESFTYAGFAAS